MQAPRIIYKDGSIIVAIKPSGVLSEDGKAPGMPSLLADGGKKPLLVHRLDREVGGVMVLAKNNASAAHLSRLICNGGFKKEYLAVVSGETAEKGVLEDMLFFDRAKNKTYVVDRERKGVKKAALEFERLSVRSVDGQTFSLLKIRLFTGRTHQIRVQFASRRHPIVGDRKYGSTLNCPTALFSHSLKFTSESGEKRRFSALPEASFPWSLFEIGE